MDPSNRLQRGMPPFLRRGATARGGLRVHADFEGGNIEAAAIFSPSHVRFSAGSGTSPHPLWFYFCIEDAGVPAVRCDLVNADRCLGPRTGWRTARPVFSADRHTWERAVRTNYVDESGDAGYFTFTVPIVARTTYVAYSYPYGVQDLSSLLRSLPSEIVTGEMLCRSREDRPVPYLRAGNCASAAVSVWVLARQHAGESPASHTAEGLLRFLASDSDSARAVREAALFHVVPMLDVDGVYHGRYGKNQAPVDFNRDWRENSVHAEIAAAARRIEETHAGSRVRLLLDLHAPHHGDTSCYLFGSPPLEPARDVESQYMAALVREAPRSVGLRETDLRRELPPPGSARDFVRRALGIPVLTLEMSYHLAQSGEYLTPCAYREFGAALARAVLPLRIDGRPGLA